MAEAQRIAKPEIPDPTKSADVVMVGCKLSNGFWMEIITPGELRQPMPTGRRIEIKGANSLRPDKRASMGQHPYALTPVPRDFWEAWLKANHDLEFVKRGFVFAETSTARAQDVATERVAERTGMEALAPEKDPRVKQIGKLGGADVEGDAESFQRATQNPA